MSKQQLEDLVECPICMEQFQTPKQLQCQHVFCLKCLQGIHDSNRGPAIRCPECRQEYPIPTNGVTGFPTSLSIQKLIEAINTPLQTAGHVQASAPPESVAATPSYNVPLVQPSAPPESVVAKPSYKAPLVQPSAPPESDVIAGITSRNNGGAEDEDLRAWGFSSVEHQPISRHRNHSGNDILRDMHQLRIDEELARTIETAEEFYHNRSSGNYNVDGLSYGGMEELYRHMYNNADNASEIRSSDDRYYEDRNSFGGLNSYDSSGLDPDYSRYFNQHIRNDSSEPEGFVESSPDLNSWAANRYTASEISSSGDRDIEVESSPDLNSWAANRYTASEISSSGDRDIEVESSPDLNSWAANRYTASEIRSSGDRYIEVESSPDLNSWAANRYTASEISSSGDRDIEVESSPDLNSWAANRYTASEIRSSGDRYIEVESSPDLNSWAANRYTASEISSSGDRDIEVESSPDLNSWAANRYTASEISSSGDCDIEVESSPDLNSWAANRYTASEIRSSGDRDIEDRNSFGGLNSYDSPGLDPDYSRYFNQHIRNDSSETEGFVESSPDLNSWAANRYTASEIRSSGDRYIEHRNSYGGLNSYDSSEINPDYRNYLEQHNDIRNDSSEPDGFVESSPDLSNRIRNNYDDLDSSHPEVTDIYADISFESPDTTHGYETLESREDDSTGYCLIL